MNDIQNLIDMLQSAKHAVVLTGAGISTLSGIPDFRGKDGIYKRKDFDGNRLFDISEFHRDPSYYYIHARDFIYNMDSVEPNIIHLQLARLEKMGIIHAIITQNIDLLHQRAGANHVLELHGSLKTHTCMKCKHKMPIDEILSALKTQQVPKCDKCGGVMKPDVVFFGEALPADVLAEAEEEASNADLMLILGSSLTVYPAAGVPGTTLRHGGKLAIINADPTPYDKFSSWVGNDLKIVFDKIAISM